MPTTQTHFFSILTKEQLEEFFSTFKVLYDSSLSNVHGCVFIELEKDGTFLFNCHIKCLLSKQSLSKLSLVRMQNVKPSTCSGQEQF